MSNRHLWYDLTTDYKTHHYVGKDVIKVLSFLFSIFLSLLKVVAIWVSGKDLGIGDLIALFLFTALGSAGIKLADKFYRRKTDDEQGNPLTVPTDEVDQPAIPPYPLANPNEKTPPPPTTDPAESL